MNVRGNSLRMRLADMFTGKPDAVNPPVRFEEGRGGRKLPLSYSTSKVLVPKTEKHVTVM